MEGQNPGADNQMSVTDCFSGDTPLLPAKFLAGHYKNRQSKHYLYRGNFFFAWNYYKYV
ncbi:hypothetical protein HMPREF0322_05119 [Desulfitobacterium hafniense DP7]|uniref:Uncharacterized protein n=1 Tax=Desulfitobacterium hafniense DP7 TaxID=537010 RepID=G9XVT6_DESHA|nr:hypothetical protein HMPREF0322_05119 [Desulfitobacterium hafniense DP7]